MANVYVDSNAAGAGTGADWANAYTTMVAAVAGKAAGDVFYVAHNHAETQASAMTITFPGTVASPNFVYCVSSAGTVPPVAADLRTTGTVSTTGASSLTHAGVAVIDGLIFSAGGGGANAADLNATAARFVYRNCTLGLATTSNRTIIIGTSTSASRIDMINTKFSFGAVGQIVAIRGELYWRETPSAISGSVPTNLFSGNASHGAIFVEGVDLSAMVTAKNIVSGSQISPVFLKDCKLDAAVTVASRQSNPGPGGLYIIRSDSSATNYRHEKRGFYYGDQTVETTIVRTGGASDGTTPIAWKLVTTANSKWATPFDAMPISVWNTVTGSAITLTVEGIWGGGAVPNNDDIWIDVAYPGDATFPTASFATSTKASGLATNSALASSSETWGGSTTKFKMTATFTPRIVGPLTVYIKAAAASSTFYVCPKVTIA